MLELTTFRIITFHVQTEIQKKQDIKSSVARSKTQIHLSLYKRKQWSCNVQYW